MVKTISQLLKTENPSFDINIMNLQKQTGAVDCALCHWCSNISKKEDPTAIVFNQAELRPHFLNILGKKL